MIVEYTEKDLIDFEEDIANEFNQGKIKAPIHLYNGNESIMIDLFRTYINPQDWVLCTWRSHYQCLLKGVPKEQVKENILNGKSISLCFPEYNIFSSAIVTGILPIAVGIGLSLKKKNLTEYVYCFVGDMTSETGSFEECLKYVQNFNLPVRFIIEDNNKSVCTDTRKTWNMQRLTREGMMSKHIFYYQYNSKWPHSGGLNRVQF